MGMNLGAMLDEVRLSSVARSDDWFLAQSQVLDGSYAVIPSAPTLCVDQVW